MSIRIIFMGTPEFAVPSLEILIRNNKNIVGVVTAEDKPQGRGQKMGVSPVKEIALKHGIKVLQPPKLKSEEFLTELRELKPDIQVVVAFRMLPEVVWSMPGRGTFNLHASLLPQYRGAAPINWVIINGEKETGVTTFFLKQEIDTGEIIFQEKEKITDDDNAGSLYSRLMRKGADLVLKTVDAIERGEIMTRSQIITGGIKPAPKIFKETCKISWDRTPEEVRNFVRGLNPYPGAWTMLGDKNCKLLNVNNAKTGDLGLGEIRTDQRSFIFVGCKGGAVAINEFQMEGKRKMKVQEFFMGNKLLI